MSILLLNPYFPIITRVLDTFLDMSAGPWYCTSSTNHTSDIFRHPRRSGKQILSFPVASAACLCCVCVRRACRPYEPFTATCSTDVGIVAAVFVRAASASYVPTRQRGPRELLRLLRYTLPVFGRVCADRTSIEVVALDDEPETGGSFLGTASLLFVQVAVRSINAVATGTIRPSIKVRCDRSLTTDSFRRALIDAECTFAAYSVPML